jgi:diguanylate cyclase (GGDEF)-like protein/PAS domain S-box-containing protein
MDLSRMNVFGNTAPATGTTGLPTAPAPTSQLADERLRCVIELTADFYWEQDAARRFTYYRPRDPAHPDCAVEQLLGESSLDGGQLLTSADGGWREFQAVLATQEAFQDVVCTLPDPQRGTRHISFSGQPIHDAAGRFHGYRGIGRDVSADLVAQRLARLENALVRILAETDELNDGLRAVIRCICESEQWQAGSFWSVHEHGRLRQASAWPTADAQSRSALRGTEVVPAWQSGDPQWLAGVGAIVPVHCGQNLVGVLDFHAPRLMGADPLLDRVLRITAVEVGHWYGRATALERLRESEQRFASTMELAAIGIAHVADDGRLLYVNPQLCKMLQYAEHELTGMTVQQISHPDDVDVTNDLRNQVRAGTIDSYKTEKRYLRKDGSPVWVGLTIAAKRDRDGRHVADISIIEDISVRKSAEDRVHYLATHDGLTGLPNRAMFGEILKLGVESAKRHGRQLAVLFIDLDRFKIINDSLGHEAGDVLLREIASRLRQCLRASDLVARLSGDEFVVLMQDVSDVSQVATVARSINSALMKPAVIFGQECRVTASIGICVHPAEGQDDQAVLKNADMAMYFAKEEGKNNYQFYTPSMQVHGAGRLTLEANLRRALELDELSLHYQAKVNFKTGAITGVEALLRWQSPLLGSVSPTQFIPVAEETGLIVPIGKWVLRTACAQNAAWQQQGLPPVTVCLNLSMRQLDDPHLIADIAAALQDSGLPPERLELEVTEGMIMHNVERATRVLHEIKALGVRLAIDDFGTGYSSLAHLKRFPIDTLKVDRSFIREIPSNAEDRAVAEAIIAMGKTLSLTIVAEGVETPEQQAFLSNRACDEMQGYYFSAPVAPAEFARLLAGHSATPRS